MRNLAFLATASTERAARDFRRALMAKTATWGVSVQVCASREEGRALLEGKSHAFAAAPAFRQELYRAGQVKGASARLASGADVLYRGERDTIALAQLARSVVDAAEDAFLPLHGARVAVLGAGTTALDFAYELSRAGVDEVILLARDKERARDALSGFLDEYGSSRSRIIDTDQARPGHLSAIRAYEHTEFMYGSLASTSRIAQADVVVNLLSDVPDAALGALRRGHIACDPWDSCSAFGNAAREVGCDLLSSTAAMEAWGAAAAEVLVEFGRAEL